MSENMIFGICNASMQNETYCTQITRKQSGQKNLNKMDSSDQFTRVNL